MAELRGSATTTIDEKGRVKLPALFTERFLAACGDDRRVFMTSLDGKVGLLYPLNTWRRVEAKLVSIPADGKSDPEAEIKSHTLDTANRWGQETQIDPQGRVLLSPRLRKELKLVGEIDFIGSFDFLRLEVAPPEDTRPPVMTEEEVKLARTLTRL